MQWLNPTQPCGEHVMPQYLPARARYLTQARPLNVEDHEHAMDALMVEHDYRIRCPDPWQDAENERLTEEQHEPVEPNRGME